MTYLLRLGLALDLGFDLLDGSLHLSCFGQSGSEKLIMMDNGHITRGIRDFRERVSIFWATPSHNDARHSLQEMAERRDIAKATIITWRRAVSTRYEEERRRKNVP